MDEPGEVNRSLLDDVTSADGTSASECSDPSDRGHLEIPLTHDPAESVESVNRAPVVLVGWGPSPVSQAPVGSAGFSPQLSANVGLRLDVVEHGQGADTVDTENRK